MAVSEGFTRVPADSTGNRLASVQGTKGGVTVHAQQVVLADPDIATYPNNYARVTDAAPADATLGLVVRQPGIGADDSTNSTMKAPVLAAKCTAAAPTWTDGRQAPLSVDTAGNTRMSLMTALPAGSNVIGHVIVDTVAGDVAHDAVDSGAPVKIGAKAATANPTAVAGADRVNAMADKVGRVVVTPFHVREMVIPNDAGTPIVLTASTAETDLLAAGGANVYDDLLEIAIENTSGTPARIDLRDAAAGTVRRSFYVGAGVSLQRTFPGGLKQTSANAKWTVQSSASVSSVYVSATFAVNV